MSKSSKIATFVALIIIAGCLIVSVFFADQIWFLLRDTISNLSYSAPAEVNEIADEIKLTNRGKFIFGASTPVIESQTDFNRHCESHDIEISTLGCYNSGKIYIYNITADELSGIKESTAAHELMHAVWARLTDSEQNKLASSILSVYNDEKYHADFAKQLEAYSEDEIVEELHSRLPTEIKNLPDALEKHYKDYFEDQDAVVDFYEKYREPFNKLENELKDLSEELETLRTKLEGMQETYQKDSEQLSRAVDEFNNCASTTNCFASNYEFNTKRAELSAKQVALNNLYQELSTLVDDYNKKVDKYNNNLLRGEELDSMMNSNREINNIK